MHLYKVRPHDHHLVHAVARSSHEAAELYVTWLLARGGEPKSFSVADIPIDSLDAQQKAKVQAAFAVGLVGILHSEDGEGWTFSPPLSQLHEPSEERGSPTEGALQ